MKQPTYDINLPARVRFDPTLCLAARMLYGEIKALSDQRGYCWASNQFFAVLYGVKRKAVSRWISQLEKQGYIRLYVDSSQGNRRQIYIANYPPKVEEISSKKGTAHPISEDSYPPKKTSKTSSLLIDKYIDNNDRVHTISSQKGIVNLKNSKVPITNDENLQNGNAVSQPHWGANHQVAGHRGYGHPPVAPHSPSWTRLPEEEIPKFLKPSVEEVEAYMLSQQEFCPNEITAQTQALRFMNYYESNGWKVGRNAMQDWQAAANNWLLNLKTYDQTSQKPRSANHLHSKNQNRGRPDYSIPL